MDSRQINIDEKLYGVVTYEEFAAHPDLYNNQHTAVRQVINGEDMALPVRSPLDKKPGMYHEGCVWRIETPSGDIGQYSAENIIDFSNSRNMNELLDKQTQVRDIERDILTSPDSITVPNISSMDQPLMRAMKEGVRAKHIDINKYEDRFGNNFANDKRALKQNSITIKMFLRMARNLDMNAKVVLTDKSPDVPNPMGREIVVDLLGGDDEDEEE